MATAAPRSVSVAAQIGELVARIQAVVRRDLARAGVSLAQARTLASLERNGSLRLTDLAVLEQVTQPTMSSLISRLENLGLVARASSPIDGRAVIVGLTPTGRASLNSIRERRERMLAAHLSSLREIDLTALESALPAFGELVARLESRSPIGRPE